MLKLNTKNKWIPVKIHPSFCGTGFENLIELEECRDYDLEAIKGSKKGTKRKLIQDTDEPKGKVSKKSKNEKLSEINKVKGKPKKKRKIKKNNVSVDPLAGKFVRYVENTDDDKLPNMEAWHFVPLPEILLRGLADQGFSKPTEIQSLTLPPAILGRRDILGAAETGSGKTLAFGLPILSGILQMQQKKMNENSESEDDEESLGEESEFGEIVRRKSNHEESDDEEEDETTAGSDDAEEESNVEEEDGSDEVENEQDETNIESDEEENDSDIDANDISDDDSEGEWKSDESISNENGIECIRAIEYLEPENKSLKPLYALILTPTRELAVQIKNHLDAVAKYTNIKITLVVGGMSSEKQERLLKKGPEIVVATPGRLWELIRLGNPHLLQINNLRYLAIDETDRMIERGHFQELNLLLERMNLNAKKKQQRQNFVFSATLTMVHELPKRLLMKKKLKIKRKITDLTPGQKLESIVQILGITDPKVVDITKGSGTSGTLTECRITCTETEKDFYVYYFLQRHPGRTLIFCNSIGCVKRLTSLMTILGCDPFPLHASMQQRQRLKNLDKFRERENSVLIATDVAARGLDIPSVEHVLHYQMPRTSEIYVHRSGRTARATKQGLTLLLIEPSEIQNYLRLCRTLGKSEDIPQFPIQHQVLDAIKGRVNLAKEVDTLELRVRKTNSEIGWFEKNAMEAELILDKSLVSKHEKKEAQLYKKQAEAKKKRLMQLLSKPIFPKGFSGKFPLTLLDSNFIQQKGQSNETAIDVVRSAIANDIDGSNKTRVKAKSLFKPRIKKANEEINLRKKLKNKGNKGKSKRNRRN